MENVIGEKWDRPKVEPERERKPAAVSAVEAGSIQRRLRYAMRQERLPGNTCRAGRRDREESR
jgi:hypothetical protein